MRLWSLHPRYLDARGLGGLWREALLAQEVLRGRTRSYAHHPQLQRFREQPSPIAAIAAYLRAVHAEGARRGYRYSPSRISRARGAGRMTVTRGQLEFERDHLAAKLARRDPQRLPALLARAIPEAHPLFRVVRGGIAPWERGARAADAPTAEEE